MQKIVTKNEEVKKLRCNTSNMNKKFKIELINVGTLEKIIAFSKE